MSKDNIDIIPNSTFDQNNEFQSEVALADKNTEHNLVSQNALVSENVGFGITGILAVAANGTIGNDNKLPWHYPTDLQHFRSSIEGGMLVMGSKTFASLPLDILKTHPHIVFSRNKSDTFSNTTITVNSIDEFLKIIKPIKQKIFMIGGGEIAKLFLKQGLLSRFILTKIHKTYTGDVFLPFNISSNTKDQDIKASFMIDDFISLWHGYIQYQSDEYDIYNLFNPILLLNTV